MDITYRKSEGSQAEKPKAIDTTSSSTVVYLRKNIQQEEREYEGETYKMWVYDEAILTHDEFDEYAAEMQGKIRSDVDYIAIMTEIDLDE